MEPTKQQLLDEIKAIEGAYENVANEAKDYCFNLAKIPGSLGRIEDLAVKLAGITGKIKNEMPKKCVIIMSSDNRIVEEGVSSSTSSVTASMTEIFTDKVTGVGVMARASGSDIIVYDVGIISDIKNPLVINKKIRYGAANFSKGPAMEYEECLQAIRVGMNAAFDAKQQGYDVIGTGEMGIGNTSSTTCVTAALTNASIDEITGKGSGMAVSEELDHKKHVLTKALELNNPDPNDVIDVLTKVGGLDIAALTGLYIGAAIARIPIVIDGYISSVAALCAYKLNPVTYDFMIESHASLEPGYLMIKDAMGLKPMFFMDMRLGEGSGCPLSFFAIDCANMMMNYMFTFEQAIVSTEYTDKIAGFEF